MSITFFRAISLENHVISFEENPMNFNLALPPNELFGVAELHRKYQPYKLTASISEYVFGRD